MNFVAGPTHWSSRPNQTPSTSFSGRTGVIDGRFGSNVDKALEAYDRITGSSLKSTDTAGIKDALAKSGGDADRLNLHLGMALARQGDKAGATAALNKVGGTDAELAKYWLVYVNRASVSESERRSLSADNLTTLLGQHMYISIAATVLTCLVAIPLGVLLTRGGLRRYSKPVITIAGFGQARRACRVAPSA